MTAVTEDNIDSLSTKAKMDYNTYVSQTAKAFTQQNLGGMQFEFQMKTRGDDSVDFIWKKHVPSDEIKVWIKIESADGGCSKN